MLKELEDLAGRFRDSGIASYIMIAICLFTVHGAAMQGNKVLYNLKNVCVEFAQEQLGGLDN